MLLFEVRTLSTKFSLKQLTVPQKQMYNQVQNTIKDLNSYFKTDDEKNAWIAEANNFRLPYWDWVFLEPVFHLYFQTTLLVLQFLLDILVHQNSV